jgi:hypothetical protein
MSHQRTVSRERHTGLTVTEIVSSYKVLESLRERFEQEGMQDEADVMNEAHYLVQLFHENGHFTEITID